MAQILENSQNFPLHIKRSADGLYTIEAVGLGLEKTGADLTSIEASMRKAVDEILLVSKRHGLETIGNASTVVHMPASANNTAAKAPGIEDLIMRWARGALIVFVVMLLIGLGIKQTVMAKFEVVGDAHVYTKQAGKYAENTAYLLESITPDRRNEVTRNLHRIAISLQPYFAELRPMWMACCGPQTESYPSSNEPKKAKNLPVARDK